MVEGRSPWTQRGADCSLLLCSPSFPTHRKFTLAPVLQKLWLHLTEHARREYRNSYILQPPFPLRHVYFTYSPRLWVLKCSQNAMQNACFSLSFMGKRPVLKVPFFVHSPGDPCVSPLVLPFKRRCQVIKLNKTSVTKTFSSGDQKSQLHLLPGTTWQHLKLRTKGKGASFKNHWRWLQIWIVFQRKCQVHIAGRIELMITKLFQFFLPQEL